MTDFRTQHHFQFMDILETVVIFGHGFPCPLGLVAVRNFVASSIGKEGTFAIAVRICVLFFLPSHGVAVFPGIFFDSAFVPLQTELGRNFKMFVQFEFCVEDGH